MRITKPQWTLAEALQLINELWPLTEAHGYYIALTGSVLRHGSSENDLDLVLYPRNGCHSDYRPAVDVIATHLQCKLSPTVIERSTMQGDYKLIVTLATSKGRVELFLPNFAFAGRLDSYVAIPSKAYTL